MLKFPLLHPEIIGALAGAGHGSRILIADGNYPFSTRCGPNAALVFLNLRPGLLSVTDVLSVLADAVPFESATVMQPAKAGRYALKTDPDIFADFVAILGAKQSSWGGGKLERLDRYKFYDAASAPDVCLTIATGEQRIYGNILLTIGVVRSVN